MAGSSNNGKSILPAASFPDLRDVNIEVGESSSEVVLSENIVEVPVLDWETALKMKWPLPSRPHHHKIKRPPPPPLPKSRLSLTLDEAIEYELKNGRDLNPNMDTKTLRRTVSNRLAAQRSRMRRWQCVAGLEKWMDNLDEMIDDLTPRVADQTECKQHLQEENDALRTAVDVRAQELKLAEDLTSDLQREIARLKQHIANIKGDGGESSNANPPDEVMVAVEPAAGGLTSPMPYSIQFYQQRMMQMQVLPTSEVAPPESDLPDSFIGLINFEDELGDDEVDQYLNLDEMYLDPQPEL